MIEDDIYVQSFREEKYMTGRDLIIHIIQNGLENEEVFKDGKLLGFMTVEEAAAKFDVGLATVRVWTEMHVVDSIKIGEVIYIPINAEYPIVDTIRDPKVEDLWTAFNNMIRGINA